MAEIRPFRGLRYQSTLVGDLGKVIAPPYDIISPEEQRALHAASPYNVVRLEYGESREDDTEEDNRYTRAAATLADWLASGVLMAEERPSFYVYDQEFQHEGQHYRRRCLLARVRLEEWDKGTVRPHEYTLSEPKKDRLSLMRACRANLSPVFALYRDPQRLISEAVEAAVAGKPPAAVAEKGEERHSLWTIDEEDVQRRLVDQFASLNLYIADGHHRYETALAYREERRAAALAQTPTRVAGTRRGAWTGEEAENFALMGLTAANDPGLLVLPVHRLAHLPGLGDAVLERLQRYLSVQEVATEGADNEASLRRLLAMMAERSKTATAFGMCWPQDGRLYLLTLEDAAQLVRRLCPDCPAAWRDLDVAVLDLAVLGMILRIDPEPIEEGGCVTYIDDARQAWQEVRAGRYSAAFLVNPVRVEQILTLADSGRRMPRKSTFFHPKLATGLVINRLDE